MPPSLHVNFDDAWNSALLALPTLDVRSLGPVLRYTAPQAVISAALAPLQPALADAPFILYGSGDFHYLAAWFLQIRLAQLPPDAPPAVLVSFDNHPDWDIRPPRWACGGWINRALEFPQLARAAVWGCGNFELNFPARLFRNRRALAAKKLEVYAWAQRYSSATARRFNCMTRENWRDRCSIFARSLAAHCVYVTIDLDCLAAEFALTNWENGLFTPDDLAWALQEIRRHAPIIAGDCCGAFSPPRYARRFQRLAGKFDHPRLNLPAAPAPHTLNHQTLKILWPALTGIASPPHFISTS